MPDDNECKVSAFDSDALYNILTNVYKKVTIWFSLNTKFSFQFSTDRVMYSDTAPTPSAVTFVPVEKDTLGMAKNVEISTSVRTPS